MRIDKFNKSKITKHSILQHNTVKGLEMRSYCSSHYKINGAVQYSTAQNKPVKHNTVLYSEAHHSTM